jgi:diadenosine tetraphosphate (Ap4A) HIT family hydrolase
MECPYCVSEDMPLLIKKYKHWRLVLADSQQLIGWCHVILNRHAEYYQDLTTEEMKELQVVLSEHRNALRVLFAPDHYNLMHMANMIKHFHFHIVPRYAKPKKYLGRDFTDQDYGKMVINRWKPEDKEFLLKLKETIQLNIK